MAQNKVTIDVEARFVDNLTGQAKKATAAIDDIGDVAKDSQKDINNLGKSKAKPDIDADDSKLKKKLFDADSKIKKLSKSKAAVVLEGVDKATNVLKKIDSTAKKLTSKAWTAVVKVKDIALAPLKKLKNALFSIKSLIGTITTALAAGFVVKKVVIEPIGLADAYSSAKISFSTLLGEKQGQQMMDDLDAFARKTPFDTSGVIGNAQKMLAMGWDAENIIEDMEILGNAAASTGNLNQGLESIVRAMSQIKTKGRLSTEELNQLAEAGIAAKAMLAEQLGYGTGDEGIAKMTADLEDGAIASDQAIEALLEGMKKFDGMMSSVATETAEGLMSQIKDTFQINIFRKWGQGLQDGAKKGLGTLVGLLDSAEDGLSNIGDMLYEVGKKASNWAAGKLEKVISRITALAETEEFKNAGIGGKIKILWDGVVADPIKEWWNGGGREKTMESAEKAGKWLGEAITNGLLTLFGATNALVDDDVGTKTGGSIAESFVSGFVDSFDGSAITGAFVDAISNIWNALPAWAKLLLGGTAVVKGGIGLGNFIGGVGNVVGTIGKGIGSASAMTGVLGFGTKAGIAMGAGNLAGGASLGAGALSALGLGATAGIATGVVTAGSGAYDLYKGFKNDDDTAKKSGAWKVGGAAGGAALGAALGSVIPGVGTLVGAGVGALAGSAIGWWQSSRTKKKAAEAAAEAAAGESGALEKLAKSESSAAVEAAKLIEYNKKIAKESLDEHFGNVTLSAEEMQWAIRNVIGEKFFEETAAATAALDTMGQSYEAFVNQSSSLKKNLWMTSIKKDAELTKDEISGLQNSADTFSNVAQTYVTDAQYAATESIRAIMGNSKDAEKLIESTNDYYGQQSDELASLSKQLSDKLTEALSDNVISIKEKESLDKIRSQMAEITRKLQEEEYEAEMNILKARYAGDMTAEGFGDLMTGTAEQNKTLAETYWDGFGRASVGKSENEIETLRIGVLDKLSNMWSKTGDLGIGTLRETYRKELGILSQDLGEMLERNTPEQIMSAVEGMSDKNRQAIGKLMEYMQPTTAEIEKLVESYEKAGLKVPEALSSYLQSAEFYEALSKGPEAVEKYFNEQEIDLDPTFKVVSPKVSGKYWRDQVQKVFNTMEVTGKLNVDWKYDKFDDEWISPDGQYSFTTEALVQAGWKYDEFNRMWISPDEKYYFYTNAHVGVDYDNNKFEGSKRTFGVRESYTTSTTVKIEAKYKVVKGSVTSLGNPKMSYISKQAHLMYEARGALNYPNGKVDSFGMGGRVTPMGNGRLIRVAEEGPEMVIPLSKQRRERGLKLWEKAGEMMKVPGFARGGLTTGGNDSIRARRYDSDEESSGRTVEVNVGGVTVEINVDASGNGDVSEAIKAQANDIAETVAGILADAFTSQFENIPTRGGVA